MLFTFYYFVNRTRTFHSVRAHFIHLQITVYYQQCRLIHFIVAIVVLMVCAVHDVRVYCTQ